MIKESEARVATAIATATASMAIPQKKLIEEDNITSEIPLEVISITLHFAGLS